MPREFICQWGNCESTKTIISLNIRGSERPRFCCEEHAAAYLIRCARIILPHGTPADVALGEIEKSIMAARPPMQRKNLMDEV
jgi:hypothetical protein